MRLEFKDGSTLDVARMFKTHDYSAREITISIEMASSATFEEVEEKDFSDFTLKGATATDIRFEGYSVQNVQESYEDRGSTLNVSLVKK